MIIKCSGCNKDFDYDALGGSMEFCPFCGNKITNYGYCENCGTPYSTSDKKCDVCSKRTLSNQQTDTVTDNSNSTSAPSQPVKKRAANYPSFIIPFDDDNAISGEIVSPIDKATPAPVFTSPLEYNKPNINSFNTTNSYKSNEAASIFSAVNNTSRQSGTYSSSFYNQNADSSVFGNTQNYSNLQNNSFGFNNRSNNYMNSYINTNDEDDNFAFAPERRSRSEIKRIQKLQEHWANETGNYNMNNYSNMNYANNSFNRAPSNKKNDPVITIVLILIVIVIFAIAITCILYFVS